MRYLALVIAAMIFVVGGAFFMPGQAAPVVRTDCDSSLVDPVRDLCKTQDRLIEKLEQELDRAEEDLAEQRAELRGLPIPDPGEILRLRQRIAELQSTVNDLRARLQRPLPTITIRPPRVTVTIRPPQRTVTVPGPVRTRTVRPPRQTVFRTPPPETVFRQGPGSTVTEQGPGSTVTEGPGATVTNNPRPTATITESAEPLIGPSAPPPSDIFQEGPGAEITVTDNPSPRANATETQIGPERPVMTTNTVEIPVPTAVTVGLGLVILGIALGILALYGIYVVGYKEGETAEVNSLGEMLKDIGSRRKK